MYAWLDILYYSLLKYSMRSIIKTTTTIEEKIVCSYV